MNVFQSITVRGGLWDDLKSSPQKHVHVVMIATKPDIIKQAPLYLELKRRGELVLLGHTGQHYDFNLSGGLEEEFGLKPDFNLNISGALHVKIAQIIERLGNVFAEIKSLGKIAVPYVHGDTTTAMAASNAAYANEFAVVHVEAGLRTQAPLKSVFEKQFKKLDFKKYRDALMDPKNYERGSIEPYPEQFNTRATEPATGLFCAPTKLNRDFLIAEGYRLDRIVVVGNTVADATELVRAKAKESTIFKQYPALEKGFIRFCIHRRENCANQARFTAIFEAIETLVDQGETVLLISLFQTKSAIENFGLSKRLTALIQKSNFVYSDVWPYYTDVIAAMEKATVCATDSGSMQEEMNIMGIPCVTLRFGSDRSETLLAGCNVVAPPLNAGHIVQIILDAKANAPLMKAPNLYGHDVSKKIVDEVIALLKREPLFCFEQDRA